MRVIPRIASYRNAINISPTVQGKVLYYVFWNLQPTVAKIKIDFDCFKTLVRPVSSCACRIHNSPSKFRTFRKTEVLE